MKTKKFKTAASSAVAKPTVNRRTRSVARPQQPGKAMPGGEQDIRRRLGNFTGAGEHARVGGRTSGIVGQTTKRGRTDKRSKSR